MVPWVRRMYARFLPHGPLDVVRQVALFAAAYYGYRIVRGAVEGRAALAFQHGRDIVNAERTLHVFWEPSIQAWASGSQFVLDAASWLYINAQTTVCVSALVWLYLFRNESFYFVRNMMVTAMAIAIVGYVLFPTAPPRFFPEWGFVDTVSDFTHVSQDNVAVNALFNPYAAVPSMHVAFSLMIGWTLAQLIQWRLLKVFWFTYPFIVTFVIVVTGNHFLTDAFFGACTAGISCYTAKWLARARPAVWQFAPAATA